MAGEYICRGRQMRRMVCQRGPGHTRLHTAKRMWSRQPSKCVLSNRIWMYPQCILGAFTPLELSTKTHVDAWSEQGLCDLSKPAFLTYYAHCIILCRNFLIPSWTMLPSINQWSIPGCHVNLRRVWMPWRLPGGIRIFQKCRCMDIHVFLCHYAECTICSTIQVVGWSCLSY